MKFSIRSNSNMLNLMVIFTCPVSKKKYLLPKNQIYLFKSQIWYKSLCEYAQFNGEVHFVFDQNYHIRENMVENVEIVCFS